MCRVYAYAYMFNCLCDLQFELRLRVENAIVLIKMTAMERVKLLHSANVNASLALAGQHCILTSSLSAANTTTTRRVTNVEVGPF